MGLVCRAENSNTHRHLCEFTGLDFEMEINEHYDEVLDVLDRLFVYIFNGLQASCGEGSWQLFFLSAGFTDAPACHAIQPRLPVQN